MAPQYFIHSLPTETVCIILKTLLDDIVEDDVMRTPDAKHRVLAGGLPFPHTMALVCRHWRDIVSSAPELWTRVFCVLPQDKLQWMSSQLQKSASYPVHLTIIHQHDLVYGIYPILRLIAPHLQRLKSLRIHEFHEAYVHNLLDTLTGHAPQLEFLRLTDARRVDCFKTQPCLKLDCPALRILHIDTNAVCDTNHQWLKKNLTHVDYMSISFGSGHGTTTYQWSGFPMLARALKAVSRRIPCLSLENLPLPVNISRASVKIGAAKVILHTRIDALAVIDDDCQTIVLRQCNFVRHLSRISLPSFNSLELDGCASKALQDIPRICTWDGNTVTVTNSRRSCIKIILYFLGAPFKRQRCSLWPRVTTLKLVAKNNFVMELPLTTLKAMINSRREAAGQENLGKDDEELDSIGFEGVRSLAVLHVHGGRHLSREEKAWFEERVRDFVWDHRKLCRLGCLD